MTDIRTIRTAQRAEDFLTALRKGHPVAVAAAAADMGLRSAYDWRDADPEFKARWEDAYEHGSMMIEEEARRRAVDGVLEPVFYQGTHVADVRKYSDALILPILRARLEKYRDRQELNHTGAAFVVNIHKGTTPRGD